MNYFSYFFDLLIGYLIDMTSHNTTALCGLDNTSPRRYNNK
jgi:hypothetical protein